MGKLKGKSSMTKLGVVLFVAVLAAIVVGGYINTGRAPVPQQIVQSIAPGTTETPGGGTAELSGPARTVAACQVGGLKTATLGLAVQDLGQETKSSTTLYSPATVAITRPDGTIITTKAVSAGTTLSFANADLSCQSENLAGKLYVLGDSNQQSIVTDFIFNGETQKDYLLRAYNTSILGMAILNSDTGANVSEAPNSLNSANETAPVTVGQSESRTRILKFVLNTNANAFGSPVGPALSNGQRAGVLLTIDNTDSTVFAKDDVTVSVLSAPGGWFIEAIDCTLFPRATAVDNADKCYLAPPVIQTGDYKFTYSQTSSKGNPGTEDDPVSRLHDIVCFQELGKVVCDTHDISNTNKGAAVQFYTANNS